MYANNCVIKVKMNFYGKNISITSIYRPPATCPKKIIVNLNEYLKILKKKKMIIKVIEKNDPVAEEYLNVMAEYGFISTIIHIPGYREAQKVV